MTDTHPVDGEREIERYAPYPDYPAMGAAINGDYVRYDDHARAIADLEAQLAALQSSALQERAALEPKFEAIAHEQMNPKCRAAGGTCNCSNAGAVTCPDQFATSAALSSQPKPGSKGERVMAKPSKRAMKCLKRIDASKSIPDLGALDELERNQLIACIYGDGEMAITITDTGKAALEAQREAK